MPQKERINQDSVLTRSTDLVFSEVDDEITMMHVETGTYYGLNRIGVAVWHLLEKPARLGTICEALVKRFDVEPEQCRAEVEPFLSQMLAKGLVMTGYTLQQEEQNRNDIPEREAWESPKLTTENVEAVTRGGAFGSHPAGDDVWYRS